MAFGVRIAPALALVGVLVGGCPQQPDAKRAATMQLRSCRPPGLDRMARCGTLPVPENRRAPEGRIVALNVVVVPARARHPEPDPLFLLAGGPGQAASEAFAPMVPVLSEVNETRDLVLVDQRGTGSSGALDCDLGPPSLQRLLGETFPEKLVRECAAELSADLTQYHTSIAVADLDAVRQALGYRKINLLGGSYGTRVALVYMRAYPDHVRTSVLDGVAPTDMAMPSSFARDAQAALERLFEDCEASESCSEAFPDLRARFERVRDQLRQTPVRLQLPHPRTGRELHVELEYGAFAGNLRALLYVPMLGALLPLTIDRAAMGDFAPFVAQTSMFAMDLQDTMSMGMFLSVVCAEDVPRVDEQAVQDTEATFLGPVLVREFQRACELWPRVEVPVEYHQPVRSSVPTLILSGQLDPVTPPTWGTHVAATLEDTRHVVVPGAGHGTISEGCVPELIADFLDAKDPESLDTQCVEDVRRPRFFIDFAGPPH